MFVNVGMFRSLAFKFSGDSVVVACAGVKSDRFIGILKSTISKVLKASARFRLRIQKRVQSLQCRNEVDDC